MSHTQAALDWRGGPRVSLMVIMAGRRRGAKLRPSVLPPPNYIVDTPTAYVCRLQRRERRFGYPTNIASMHLVMGCPNARAGVRIV